MEPKTLHAIFCLGNKFSGAVFGLHNVSCPPWRFFHQCVELRVCMGMIKFPHALFVILFAQAFIEKIIFLLPQPHTSKTVFTASAVVAKTAVRAIFEILGVVAVIALVYIDAFITELAGVALVAIHTVLGFYYDSAIEAVAIKICRKEEIAVFILVGVCAVVGIFRAHVNVIEARCFEAQQFKFLK